MIHKSAAVCPTCEVMQAPEVRYQVCIFSLGPQELERISRKLILKHSGTSICGSEKNEILEEVALELSRVMPVKFILLPVIPVGVSQ